MVNHICGFKDSTYKDNLPLRKIHLFAIPHVTWQLLLPQANLVFNWFDLGYPYFFLLFNFLSFNFSLTLTV